MTARQRPKAPSAGAVARSALDMARSGDHDRAVSALRQKLAQSALTAGEGAELRLVMARVLLDAERPTASVAELVKVLQVDAHRPDALLLLAEALIECDEAEKAGEILVRARSSGADPSRIDALQSALRGDKPSPNGDGEKLSLLIGPDQPTVNGELRSTDSAAFSTVQVPRQPIAELRFDDDEMTMPWIGRSGELGALERPTEKADPVLIEDPDFDDNFDLTYPERKDLEAALDTAPRQAHKPQGLSWGDESTALSATTPRAWSIGDPARAGVSASSPPPLVFDEDTVTGSFDDVRGDVLGGLDKQVRKRMSRDRRMPTAKVKLEDTHQHEDPFTAPTPRSPHLPPLGPPPPHHAKPPQRAQMRHKAPAPEKPAPIKPLLAELPPSLSTPVAPLRRHSGAFRAISPAAGQPVVSSPPHHEGRIPTQPEMPIVANAPDPAPRHRHPRKPPPEIKPPNPVAAQPEPSPKPKKKSKVRPVKKPTPLRQPDLLDKLAAEHARRSDKAPEPEEPAPKKLAGWPLVVIAALGILGGVALIGGVLIGYPVLHYQNVNNIIDANVETATTKRQQDTWGSFLLSQDHLKAAVDAEGPIAALTPLTDGYLLAIGVDAHHNRRLEATAQLAEIQAILETRYGKKTEPGAQVLLDRLAAESYTSAAAVAASARLKIGRGELRPALKDLEAGIDAYPGSVELEHLSGLARWDLGESDKAREHFDTARRRAPKHIPSRLALGRWFADRGDATALQHFDDILRRLSTEHTEATTARALFWLETGQNTEQARDDLRRLTGAMASATSPREQSMARFALARFHRKTGESDEALRQLDKAMSLDPGATAPLIERAEIFLEADRLDDARKAISQASAALGEQIDTRRLEAHLDLLEGRPDQALEKLGQVAEADGVSQALKGHLLTELGRYTEAERAFDAAVKADPRSTERPSLSMLRAILGRDDALRTLRDASRENPKDAAAQWRYGRALAVRGQARESLAPLKAAAKLDPEGRFHFRLPPDLDVCRTHMAMGKTDKASRSCQRAMARRPAYLPPYLLLSRIATGKHDHAAAREVLLSALKIRPEDFETRALLVRALLALRDFDKATAQLRPLLASFPNQAQVLTLQGLMEFRKHEYSKAMGYFQRAHELDAKNAEVRYHLAWCQLQNKRLKEAYKHINALTKDRTWSPLGYLAAAEYHRRQGNGSRAFYNARTSRDILKKRRADPERIAQARLLMALGTELNRGLTHRDVQRDLTGAVKAGYAPALFHQARIYKAKRETADYLETLQSAVDKDKWYCPAVTELRAAARTNRRFKARIPETCQKK